MTPVKGSEIPLDKVPGAVSQVSGADIQSGGSPALQDALQQYVPGAVISDVTGNGFSVDVQYRGFSASPVEGTPQGLAVYQNGVRINEVFGDTVNWDLIPSNAINGVTVVSGNPLYGLNALGGALNITMKDGFGYHGIEFGYARRLLGPFPGDGPGRQAGGQFRGLCRGRRHSRRRLARAFALGREAHVRGPGRAGTRTPSFISTSPARKASLARLAQRRWNCWRKTTARFSPIRR